MMISIVILQHFLAAAAMPHLDLDVTRRIRFQPRWCMRQLLTYLSLDIRFDAWVYVYLICIHKGKRGDSIIEYEFTSSFHINVNNNVAAYERNFEIMLFLLG